jgi:aminopeptidase-like protein
MTPEISPNESNQQAMWELMVELFPIYRSLAGPGITESLQRISNQLSLDILEVPSGTKVFDWMIPKEFSVVSSYVVDPNGQRILDYEDHSYHTYLYGQPFHGKLSREQLIENIATHHMLPDAIPLRMTYYREKWGLCAAKNTVDALPEGEYEIHIDTRHEDGFLRMGEHFLPGEIEDEILITSYLCHPRGANDNLSGAVVATELFKLLSELPNRHYSYRLAIWPETIGAITYIWKYPERLKRTVGGYVLLCQGDDENGLFNYKPSFQRDALIDRAMAHALRHAGYPHRIRDDWNMHSDERQFNGIGVRIPFGALMRSLPGEFAPSHSSADDLSYIKPEVLLRSLDLHCRAIAALERCRTYRGTFTVEPFLTGHGIYPFDLGVGEGTTRVSGEEARRRVEAFFHLMWHADGTTDLLEIADRAELDLGYFDRPVREYLDSGLLVEALG